MINIWKSNSANVIGKLKNIKLDLIRKFRNITKNLKGKNKTKIGVLIHSKDIYVNSQLKIRRQTELRK
jgi:hypothetical protein